MSAFQELAVELLSLLPNDPLGPLVEQATETIYNSDWLSWLAWFIPVRAILDTFMIYAGVSILVKLSRPVLSWLRLV